MKTLSRSIRQWFSNNRQERLSELRQPKKSRKKAAASLRPTFEHLEDRTLMSVLPQPIVLGQTDISQLLGNETTPTVAVDPLNPQKLVAAFEFSPTNIPTTPHGDKDQTAFVEAAFSTDGGQNWVLFFDQHFNLSDATETPSQGDPGNTLEMADSPSVAIDRAGGVYLVYAEHTPDNAAG
jgi:hypothetical protein